MRFTFLLIPVAAIAIACGQSDPEAFRTVTPAPSATVTDTTVAPPTATAGSASPGAATYRLGVPSGVPHTAVDPAFEPLPGARALTGTLGGAVHRIEVPDEWNGDLVLYAHGYRGETTTVTVNSPPRVLREELIADGFAWAASSFSENGYAPGIGADDTLALKAEFARVVGVPGRTLLYGESMGGNIIALSLEHYGDHYDGALAVCGAMGGQEQIDFLASWAMLAEFTSGRSIPLGEAGATISLNSLLELNAILGSPAAPTTAGAQFLSAVKMLTGGPRPFYLEGFAEQYIANFGFLLVDPARATPVTRAATNADHVYAIEPGLGIESADLNAGVRRLAADSAYRNAESFPDRVPTTGRISDPLLALHNTGDLFVPISQQVDYRAKAEAAGSGDWLVQRAIRAAGHCRFSDAELLAAWDDLVAWVYDGIRPGGDDLSGDLEDIGRAYTDPLREGDPGTR